MKLISDNAKPVQRDRLIRLPEVELLTGLKKSTIYRLCRAREFPPSVQISGRATAWSENHVRQWVQSKISESVARNEQLRAAS